MGQKANVAFLLFSILFLLVITGPTLVATTRHEEELCSNFAILEFVLFSENTNFYYKLDKVHFFLNAFISSDTLL